MPSFTDVANGATAQAADVQQIIDVWKGTSGKGVPAALTAVNDAVNFSLAIKNNDAGASKGFIVYNAAGTVLFQVDKNGVIASADGIAGASQIPTLTAVQTFTNKTLTSPHFTSPVVDSGGLTVTVGNLTISSGTISVTDGTNGLIQSAGTTGDLYLRAKNASQFVRMDTGGVIVAAGAAGFQTSTTTALGFYGHAVVGQSGLGAAATDLASVITLANNIRTALQGNGMCA